METMIMLSRSSRNYKGIFATQQEQKCLTPLSVNFWRKKLSATRAHSFGNTYRARSASKASKAGFNWNLFSCRLWRALLEFNKLRKNRGVNHYRAVAWSNLLSEGIYGWSLGVEQWQDVKSSSLLHPFDSILSTYRDKLSSKVKDNLSLEQPQQPAAWITETLNRWKERIVFKELKIAAWNPQN